MISDHIGSLKSLLYWPIFGIFRPSVLSIRMPMVLACALAIWLFYSFCTQTAGRRAAGYAALLLASDPSYFLTGTFDWGPVAVERLLIVVACLFFARFANDRREWHLAAGFCALGLALWNRADFVWALAGFAVAGVAVFWREMLGLLNWRTGTVATVAFVAGMLPLLIYNLKNPNATLSTNARVEFNQFGGKFQQLRFTMDGSDLLGFLVSEDWDENPKPVRSSLGRTAAWIRRHFGEHRHDGMAWAFVIALLAGPLWWKSRTAWFSLIFMVITWLSMAVTHNAGAAAHHAMMLWPFPQLFVGIVLAALPWSWVAGSLAALLVALNLLVLNEYLLQFETDGAALNFTDALYPLSDALVDVPGQSIYVTDWGIFDTVMLFHWGHLSLRPAGDLFAKDVLNADDQKIVTQMLSDPHNLFVGHMEKREVFPGTHQHLDRAAAERGLRKDLERVINDSNGRPVFELFRFRPAGQ